MARQVIRDTRATPVTLPVYLFFSAIFGGIMFAVPETVMSQNPIFEYTNEEAVPLWVWGFAFSGVAITLVFALFVDDRMMTMVSLGVFMVVLGALALVFLLGVIFGGGVPTAPLWPATFAILVWASIRSLNDPSKI